MTVKKFTCILLTSGNRYLADSAQVFANTLFDVYLTQYYDRSFKKLNSDFYNLLQDNNNIDFLFNFLSPVIVPLETLKAIKKCSINFHPAPPKWPGVGSASYALYENDKEFGVTAHLMEEKVDSGKIIKVIRFPIFEDDTCDYLFERALNYSLLLFYEILTEIALTGQVPVANETWKRKAISRANFEKWMTLNISDSPEEVSRKIRATRHSRFPGPYLEFGGYKFELPPRKNG
jgi:methionyl-tRNA formyltransferase